MPKAFTTKLEFSNSVQMIVVMIKPGTMVCSSKKMEINGFSPDRPLKRKKEQSSKNFWVMLEHSIQVPSVRLKNTSNSSQRYIQKHLEVGRLA